MRDLAVRLHRRWHEVPPGLVPAPLQFEFGDGSTLHLRPAPAAGKVVLAGTGIAVVAGPHAQPALRIRVDAQETLAELLTGRRDVLSAFMEERLRADGFIVAAVGFLNVFAGRPEAE